MVRTSTSRSAADAGHEQRQQHIDEQLEGVRPEHPRRRLDLGIDLLDERDHDQDHEGHGRHEIGRHHPQKVPARPVR